MATQVAQKIICCYCRELSLPNMANSTTKLQDILQHKTLPCVVTVPFELQSLNYVVLKKNEGLILKCNEYCQLDCWLVGFSGGSRGGPRESPTPCGRKHLIKA